MQNNAIKPMLLATFVAGVIFVAGCEPVSTTTSTQLGDSSSESSNITAEHEKLVSEVVEAKLQLESAQSENIALVEKIDELTKQLDQQKRLQEQMKTKMESVVSQFQTVSSEMERLNRCMGELAKVESNADRENRNKEIVNSSSKKSKTPTEKDDDT